jgi:hypothetical protein
MWALHFAIATANLACQVAFLFLATHGPMFFTSFVGLLCFPSYMPTSNTAI